MNWSALAKRVADGETPEGAVVVSSNAKRTTLQIGDAFLKVFRERPEVPLREARAMQKAASRGVPVPELLGAATGWIATARVPGRAATREDLVEILAVAEPMHRAGVLHGDLHLGNLMSTPNGVVVLDWQRARFWPAVPGPLRRWELGFLGFSLGEPLPSQLAHVKPWVNRRAQTHWKSRTKRATIESSGFTRYREGWRRREVEPALIDRALEAAPDITPFKRGSNGDLFRFEGWILKRHTSPRAAKTAWRNGQGLEARGFATGRAVAWLDHWLVMSDVGETLIDWVEREYRGAAEALRDELADTLGDWLARLHRRGVYHADLKANNVVWRPGTEPRLLDYGDVEFARRVSPRRRTKNLAQLNAALPDEVLASARQRAFDRYADHFEVPDRDRLRRRVVAESLARNHRWSGANCADVDVSPRES